MLLRNFRRSFARIYGASAITWWSWLIPLPFALTVMSGLQYVTGGPLAVLAVSALQHVLLGVLLLAGAAVLRVVRGRARPFVVFAIFAVVGAVRPILFLQAGGLLSVRVVPGELTGRMAINVVVMVVTLSLIAAGVDLVRDHRAVFRRLRAAQRASERDVECAAERLRLLRVAAVDDVAAALEAAAASAAATSLRPDEAARLLRTLAEDVVRPASHRVFSADAPVAAPEAAVIGAREWAASVLGGTRAASPVMTAVVFSVLVLPFAVLMFGARSLLPVAAGLVLLLVANALIARLPLPGRGAWRLALLLLLYAVTGVLLVLTGEVTLTLVGVVPTSVWFEAVMYPIVAVAVAFVGSLAVRTRLDRQELETALQENVTAAARIRSDYERERASLARLLHAGVQSELIAGALAVTVAPADGAGDTSERIAEVVGRARDALRGSHDEPGAEEQVRTLLDSWSSAIALRARIGEGVWERLTDPARSSAVVETVSEGLTNAVRHGDGSAVLLDLRPAGPQGVEVVIVSGGTLVSTQPGIGLKQLSEHGTVALSAAAGRVELAVAIP